MNKTETAKLLTIASMIDNRTVAPETVEAWHDVLGHLTYGLAKAAMSLHRRESTDYLMPAHITKNIPRVKLRLATDIRAAKARGLIGEWPEDEMLSPDVMDALTSARQQATQFADLPHSVEAHEAWRIAAQIGNVIREVP